MFYSTIKSRMLVTEVVNRIRSGAMWTFDYVALLLIASLLAFNGLLEDSSVLLVSSMLVSPIMGPILAVVFGAVISDKRLRNRGIVHGIVSLGMCIAIGFIFGLMGCPFIEWGQYDTTKWPTTAMIRRGEVRGLLFGLGTAIPSGAGVALSVLGSSNAGPLVGLPVSAALLLPAVNAGLFWSAAIVNPSFVGKRLDKQNTQNGF